MNFDNHQLNLNWAWRIGEEGFLKIVDLINEKVNLPNYILEFGSGASSVRLVLSFPQTKIISIDADLDCYHQTQELAKEFLQPESLFELQYQPLSFQEYGLGTIFAYTQDNSLNNLSFDCVIIDGPPFYTLRGREACLYQVYNQLRIGGIVILDDFNRESEKIILKNWLSVYPDSFDIEIIESGHHLAILQKKQSVEPDFLNEYRHNDSMEINQKYRKLRAAFLNLKDADFIKILESLPSNVIIPALKDKDNLDNFLKLMLTIQTTYQSASDQVNFIYESQSNLTAEEIFQQQTEIFCSCLDLLNLTQSNL